MPKMHTNAPMRSIDPRRVLIAEDHPLYREALRAVIPLVCTTARIAEAGCQQEVLEQLTPEADFDLVLLDLNLPGAEGLSCLRSIRAIAPLTPIIVVSGNDDPGVMSEVVMAGAAGYVPKSSPRQLLLDAIRMVMEGGSYLPAAAMVALRRAQSEDGPPGGHAPSEHLTTRQKGVLQLLAQGLSNKRIARELDISEITVKAHVSLILKKLGVSNRVQAAIEARKRLSEGHRGA